MPEEIARAFLARLWELQADAGVSNNQLARQLNVTASYVSRLKRGQRPPNISLDFALRAASIFPELRAFLSAELPVSNTDTACEQSDTEDVQ